MSEALPSRSLDLVFVIDPIGSLNAAHDTSVALMESAQARGHRVLVTTMAQLGVCDGQATAVCAPVRVTPATLEGGIASVLERFFARHAAINSFSQLTLRTPQRGVVMRWPPTVGRREVV